MRKYIIKQSLENLSDKKFIEIFSTVSKRTAIQVFENNCEKYPDSKFQLIVKDERMLEYYEKRG